MSIGLSIVHSIPQTIHPGTTAVALSRGWRQYLRRSSSFATAQPPVIMPTTSISSTPLQRDAAPRADDSSRGRGGWRGRGRGRGRAVANTVFEHSTRDAPLERGDSTQRGLVGWRGPGRGQSRGQGARGGKAQATQPRPTHSLPLHTHAPLRALVSSFQNALLSHDPPIAGLDKSIVIDPRRLHLTLGVMALEEEDRSPSSVREVISSEGGRVMTGAVAESVSPSADDPTQASPRPSVQSALALLSSLQPQISAALSGSRVRVPLERMDVFPPGATANANVLFLGPKESAGEDWERLWSISNLIHSTFKSHGYITETRPLKLHCTILNASHRKPRFPRQGFSFEGILKAESATQLLGAVNSSAYLTLPQPESKGETVASRPRVTGIESSTIAMGGLSLATVEGETISERSTVFGAASSSNPPHRGKLEAEPVQEKRQSKWPKSSPLPVKAGTYDVDTVELWVMGSHGENNEYVSLGGIKFE